LIYFRHVVTKQLNSFLVKLYIHKILLAIAIPNINLWSIDVNNREAGTA